MKVKIRRTGAKRWDNGGHVINDDAALALLLKTPGVKKVKVDWKESGEWEYKISR